MKHLKILTPLKTLSSLTAALVVATAFGASADAQDALKSRTYHFGTHPARTSVTFTSEADIETIHGTTNVLEGSIRVDAQGKSASGTITIPVKHLKTGIGKRDEHLRSDAWLHEAKHRNISLRLISARENARNPKLWDYTADLTIKGVTRRITGQTRVSAIPARFSKSLGGGEWVRVRTKFDVKVTDYGVNVPQSLGAKVSSTWTIGIDLYGTTVAPRKR